MRANLHQWKQKMLAKLCYLFYADEWQIAIRKRSGNLLFQNDGLNDTFTIIPNTIRYWCADPFLIHRNGKDYVFFEMFDRLKARGQIGYREIFGEAKYSKIKMVLDRGKHLSYPYIFEQDGEVYFIPESGSCGEVAVYKAVAFPDQWEKQTVLMKDIIAYDTSFIDDKHMLTYVKDPIDRSLALRMFCKCNEQWEEAECSPVEVDGIHKRCGGKIFKFAEQMIRPAQNGGGGYGSGIDFCEITKYRRNEYREKLIREIKPENVKNNKEHKYDGLHTYNFDEQYEVIDYKIKNVIHPLAMLGRCFSSIKRHYTR